MSKVSTNKWIILQYRYEINKIFKKRRLTLRLFLGYMFSNGIVTFIFVLSLLFHATNLRIIFQSIKYFSEKVEL